MKKRLLSFLVAAVMVLSLMPVTAFATEPDWGTIGWITVDPSAQSYEECFKVANVTEGMTVTGLDKPGFATEISIIVECQSVISDCNLGEGTYDLQGSKICLHASAFTNQVTDVTISWNGGSGSLTVYNKNGATWLVNEGDNHVWYKLESGKLTIGGTGAMPDFTVDNRECDTPWFSAKDTITSIEIGSGVKRIGTNAFYSLANVKSVDILEGVEVIGYRAFASCGLISVTIPSSLKSIEAEAFTACSKVSELHIPSIKSWFNISVEGGSSSRPFGNSSATGKNLYIGASATPTTEIVIPDDITSIPDFAFIRVDGITKVTIPNSVTSIGNSAFSSCKGLTSVIMEAGVKSIGDGAFSSCSKLTEITLPNTVTSIGSTAFQNCSELTSITIPNSVTSIGSNAFQMCRKLNELHIGDIGSWCNISFADTNSHPFNAGAKEKKVYVGKSDTPTTEIVIPEGVETINQYAFYKFDNITSVTIPSSVTSIGSQAFGGCANINELHIGDIGSWCNISFADTDSHPFNAGAEEKKVYVGKSDMPTTEIVIQEGVETINDYAFYYFDNITSVTIPSGVTSIGQSAFYKCAKLNEITIPSSVTSIGNLAFYNCTGLTNITIPSSVTSIGDSAFYGCTSLTSVTIPSSVTSIGKQAFYGCTSLASIIVKATTPPSLSNPNAFLNINAGFKIYVPKDAKTAYAGGFAWDATDIQERTAEAYMVFITPATNGAVTINQDYFPTDTYTEANETVNVTVTPDDGYQLKEGSLKVSDGAIQVSGSGNAYTFTMPKANVTIKAEFEAIPGSAANPWEIGASGNESNVKAWLEEVTPATDPKTYTLTIEGTGAMFDYEDASARPWSEYGNSITNVQINQGVTSLGNYAFASFESLVSVEIPASVTSIGVDVFEFCSSLAAINVSEGNADYASVDGVLFNKEKSILYRYPIGKNGTTYTIPASVTEIREDAFNDCATLTDITIPERVTTIGESAFDDCTGLKSIVIPEGVTKIEDYTFDGCKSLESVTLPEGIETIGEEAFWDNDALVSIVLPSSLREIGPCAFELSDNLETVTLLATTPPSLGDNAVFGNTALSKIYVPEASVDAYKLTSGWSEYAGIIEVIPLTIADILPDDFPETSSSGWVRKDDDNDNRVYIEGLNLNVFLV